jgi:hypothetical protein
MGDRSKQSKPLCPQTPHFNPVKPLRCNGDRTILEKARLSLQIHKAYENEIFRKLCEFVSFKWIDNR